MDELRTASELCRALEQISFHVARHPQEMAGLRSAHAASKEAEKRAWAVRREEQANRQASALTALEADRQRMMTELAEEIDRLPLKLKPRMGIFALIDLLETLLSIDLERFTDGLRTYL